MKSINQTPFRIQVRTEQAWKSSQRERIFILSILKETKTKDQESEYSFLSSLILLKKKCNKPF